MPQLLIHHTFPQVRLCLDSAYHFNLVFLVYTCSHFLKTFFPLYVEDYMKKLH